MPNPGFPIIDADSHLSEDLARLAALTDEKYRHFTPRMVQFGPEEVMYQAGEFAPQPRGMTWGDTSSRGALRTKHRTLGKWADAEQVGYDPKLRLEMMDQHGVQASVIFPSQGLIVSTIKPANMSAGICRGVNRYQAEFCSADRNRLHPMMTLPMGDVDLAIQEAKYAVKELGAAGLFAPGAPSTFPIYHSYYEPLWDVVEELGVPFCTHTGGAVMQRGLGVERFQGMWPAFHMTTHTVEAMLACVGFFTYGVLDRHPNMKLGFFEAGAGWVPFWIDKLNEKFVNMGYMMPDCKRSPLRTFKEQCMVTVEADEAMLKATMEFTGGRCVGWSSDVPHFDAEDEGRPDALLNNKLSDAHKRRLLCDNVAEFFKIKVPVTA
jgi:predicted TIM-barrel fold metal-dependent hydrolase